MNKVLVSVMLGAALIVTGCGGEKNGYDELSTDFKNNGELRDEFMTSCTSAAESKLSSEAEALSYCSCVLDEYANRFSPDEIKEKGTLSTINQLSEDGTADKCRDHAAALAATPTPTPSATPTP